MRGLSIAAAVLTLAAGAARAACPDDAAVAAFLADRAAARPAAPPVPAGGALDDALCAQRKIAAALEAELGRVVGWKAGLTSWKSQEAFGVSEPVLGVLLAGMIGESGATVRAADAVRPLFEADLVVEIGSAAAMDARTPAEVLPHIRGVRPFLELPALAVAPETKLDGAAIVSINVGAWKGLMGPLAPIPDSPEGLAMLADFTARLTDGSGATLSEAPGRSVLGHPLNSVIWVAGMLKRQGLSLRPGDLVSVGSLGPLHPMKPGMQATLTYEGLPGALPLTVSFE